MSVAGTIRGSIAFGLAVSLKIENEFHKSILVSSTLGLVMLTTLIFGAIMPFAIKFLKSFDKNVQSETKNLDLIEVLKDKKNEEIRNKFERNRINLIGSFKKLRRGANLGGLDNCVIMSYYSKERDLIQMVGRLRYNSKDGKPLSFAILLSFYEKLSYFRSRLFHWPLCNLRLSFFATRIRGLLRSH